MNIPVTPLLSQLVLQPSIWVLKVNPPFSAKVFQHVQPVTDFFIKIKKLQ
jgi:hypothetical protein